MSATVLWKKDGDGEFKPVMSITQLACSAVMRKTAAEVGVYAVSVGDTVLELPWDSQDVGLKPACDVCNNQPICLANGKVDPNRSIWPGTAKEEEPEE